MKENEPLFVMAESFKEEFDMQLKQLKRFTNHGPTLGRYVELLLINLLKKYSPKSIEFTSGFLHSINPIIDAKTSAQIDIICYDRINYPIIFDSNEFTVITPNSAKSLVEIKSTLTKDSIEKGLIFLENKLMNEVPLTTKLFFVASSSKIKPKATFELLKKYYLNEPKSIRMMGGIYSLDWNEMIHCDLRHTEKNKVKYTCLRLDNENGIAPFFSYLLLNCVGKEAHNSIVNLLNPSLFIPIDSFDLTLYGDRNLVNHFR